MRSVGELLKISATPQCSVGRMPSRRTSGLTVLEIVLALVVLSALAAATMSYVRQPAETVKREACNLRVGQLNTLILQYQADNRSLPSTNLSQLSTARYLGATLPVCPVDGRPYVLDTRTGQVVPHGH